MRAADPQLRRIRRIGQIALGAIWLIDGALQLQPFMFGKGFVTGVILPNAAGQPGEVASLVTWMAHDIQPHVALFNALAAALQLAIGLALLFPRTVKPALAASFVWAALIWAGGEGLGNLLTGTASPLSGAPGAALLYIVVGAMVWPRRRVSGAPTGTGIGGRVGTGISGRLAWPTLWLGSAALWLLPANDSAGSLHDAIAQAPSGAGWLTDVLNAVAGAASGHGTVIAAALAAVSATIGLSALTGVAERASILAAVGLSLVFWVLGQGLGGIFTGSATDVSTAPLVVLMGWILLARTRVTQTAVYAAAPATRPSSPAACARMAEPRRSFSSAFRPVLRSTR